jgi:cytochrome c biogenesis protein CcmG, thiol:disulfide interchange protein DsbE
MDRAARLAVAVAFAPAACGHGSAGGSSSESQISHVGQAAPAWTEPSLPGPTLSLASLQGKAIYLNFFATWCPPCNEEAPTINALARQYANRGLAVVGVDVLESAGKAAQFRTQHQLVYPVVADQGELRRQYRINGLPVHVFIGRNGVVRNIYVGELSPAGMRANVEQILR